MRNLMLMKMAVLTQQPKIVSGTINLINDATTWVMAIAAVATILLCIWHLFKYQIADENEKPRCKKNATSTVIIGVLITLVSGLVKLILSYYA